MNVNNVLSGSLFALMLIVAGALLFLDNLGILPLGDIEAYWPVWMILLGVLIVDRRKSVVAIIWAVALIACGILLILGNLRVLHVTEDVVYPMILIAFGATLLARPASLRDWNLHALPGRMHFAASMRSMRRRQRFSGWRSDDTSDNFAGDTLNEAFVFRSMNRRVESQQFGGGKLDVVFGSIELDLSGASISAPDRRAELEANAVFGGIEIRVPRTWKVIMRSTSVFGGCDDKTIPPRPEPGLEPATLVIRGGAVFGGIEIRN
jgi:hypothetical protein